MLTMETCKNCHFSFGWNWRFESYDSESSAINNLLPIGRVIGDAINDESVNHHAFVLFSFHGGGKKTTAFRTGFVIIVIGVERRILNRIGTIV